jgi:hypothetical protein
VIIAARKQKNNAVSGKHLLTALYFEKPIWIALLVGSIFPNFRIS